MGFFKFLSNFFGRCTAKKAPKTSKLPEIPSPFVRLPREIRDIVYRMLLLTSYNYSEELSHAEREEDLHNWLQLKSRWKLHPAILRANKQISAEGARILNMENELIMLEGLYHAWHDLDPAKLHTLRSFSGSKALTPALRISMMSPADAEADFLETLTLVTTIDAMPLLMQAIWRYFETRSTSEWIIEAHFHSWASSRRAILHGTILERLKQLHGFAEVRFEGNIEGNDLLSLRSCMTSNVLPNDLICHLDAYQQKADACFDLQNYTAAWTSWDQMRNYLDFCNNEFDEADLKVCWGLMMQANLGQVKLLIQLKHYKAAEECAKDPIGWIDPGMSSDDRSIALGWMDPLLHAKLFLCRSLATIAQGNTSLGTWLLKRAVEHLHNTELYASRKQQDLFEELFWAIDAHLEQARIPGKNKVYPQRLRIKYWQPPTGCLSVWEWLKVSEDIAS